MSDPLRRRIFEPETLPAVHGGDPESCDATPCLIVEDD
jgi:hypothetical protein